MSTPVDIPLETVLEALLDSDTPLNPRFLYRLSDLEDYDLEQIASIWSGIPVWRRQALMEDIEDLSISDTLLSYLTLASFALQDGDPRVRFLAARALWEYDEKHLILTFLKLLQEDSDAAVRATAAGALGRFVYAGELGKIPQDSRLEIEDVLIEVAKGADSPPVQRSALEALGYSGRDDVVSLIETAFKSQDMDWVSSALLAMGRSANERWQPQILTMLEHKLPVVRAEAARAAGELEVAKALALLLELLDDPDDNTRSASIWSLSQIGGEGVRETLEELHKYAESEQDIDLLESALDNLAFNEGWGLMPLFDLPEDSPNDLEADPVNPYEFSNMDNEDQPA